MPDDNLARKSFEAGATTAREAVDRGTAAAEQATRQAEQSYSSTAEGLREFNAKLLDIAQANTMAYMNFVSELTRVKGPIAAGLMRSVTGQQIGKSDPVRRAALAARKRRGA